MCVCQREKEKKFIWECTSKGRNRNITKVLVHLQAVWIVVHSISQFIAQTECVVWPGQYEREEEEESNDECNAM